MTDDVGEDGEGQPNYERFFQVRTQSSTTLRIESGWLGLNAPRSEEKCGYDMPRVFVHDMSA